MPNHAGTEDCQFEHITFLLSYDWRWKLEVPGGKPKYRDWNRMLLQAFHELGEERQYYANVEALEHESNPHIVAINADGLLLEGNPEEYEGDVTFVFIHNEVSGADLNKLRAS